MYSFRIRLVLKVLGFVGAVTFVFGSGALTAGYFLNAKVEELLKTTDIQAVLWSYKTLQALDDENIQQAYELQEKRLRSSLYRLKVLNVDDFDNEYMHKASDLLKERRYQKQP